MMKLILQPKESKSCGQHCVAMITGKPIDEVYEVFGKKSATTTKDMITALKVLDIKPLWPNLIRLPKCQKLPDLCLIKYHWANNKKVTHWVVKEGGVIYDPVNGCYMIYSPFMAELGAIPTSYLPFRFNVTPIYDALDTPTTG